MKSLLFLFIFQLNLNIFSQNKFVTIVDSVTKATIQYCNFYSQNEEFAQHSDLNERGSFFQKSK